MGFQAEKIASRLPASYRMQAGRRRLEENYGSSQ